MAKTITRNGETFVEMLSERRIQARVRQLGRKISSDYRNSVPVLIGVLNGSFVFFADLVREISIDCEVDFLKLSSYGEAKISSGKVRMLKDLNCKIEGRDILVVEDIVDSGLTMEYIMELVLKENPRSFRIVTLLFKEEAVKAPVHLDYVGFTIPSDFVVGYGLDHAQRYRNLRGVYRVIVPESGR